jgi:hypothetical protein
MGEIFNKMEGVTKRMMAKDRAPAPYPRPLNLSAPPCDQTGDPRVHPPLLAGTSEHYALASSPAYAPTRDWLGSRLDAFLRTPRGGGAKHEVATRARD